MTFLGGERRGGEGREKCLLVVWELRKLRELRKSRKLKELSLAPLAKELKTNVWQMFKQNNCRSVLSLLSSLRFPPEYLSSLVSQNR